MALKWEDWATDPALNTAPPPAGAPELATRYRDTNDIMRYIMAAVAEIGNWINDVEDSIGTLGTQEANAVAITGGTIAGATLAATNSIDGAAIKTGTVPVARLPTSGINSTTFNGLTLQQIYNHIYPIGTIRFTASDDVTYPVPVGITATWSRVLPGASVNYKRFVGIIHPDAYVGSIDEFMVFGAAVVSSTFAGAHAHGGSTGERALTIAQMPAHTHTEIGAQAGGNTTGYRSEATVQTSGTQNTGSTGGGQSHDHSITAVDAHRHDVDMDPAGIGFIAWKRTS